MKDDPNSIYQLDGVTHITNSINEKFIIMQPTRCITRGQHGCIDKFIANCTWIQDTFSELPQEVDEDTVRRYVRAYIMMLLSTQFFGDKSGTSLHIRWLPYIARLEDTGRYIWGTSLLHGYIDASAVWLTETLLSWLLLQSWIFWHFLNFRRDGFDVFHWPLASRCSGYQSTLSEKGPRVAH
ncbi:hypothetical protein Ahy_B08g090145 [Arachis hypogaea]|uniref:Aminotransferase-like plant mobile domain-containing protein n=1 Tax=Arachis hypogaea TaxID=3818 RepID=A0A444XZN0_ARAHY|nr:hypothetical protein Ahy_B08g090145 [Arachis hypogaea]